MQPVMTPVAPILLHITASRETQRDPELAKEPEQQKQVCGSLCIRLLADGHSHTGPWGSTPAGEEEEEEDEDDDNGGDDDDDDDDGDSCS